MRIFIEKIYNHVTHIDVFLHTLIMENKKLEKSSDFIRFDGYLSMVFDQKSHFCAFFLKYVFTHISGNFKNSPISFVLMGTCPWFLIKNRNFVPFSLIMNKSLCCVY